MSKESPEKEIKKESEISIISSTENSILKAKEPPKKYEDIEKINSIKSLTSLEDLRSFAETLIEGNLVPFSSPEQVLTVISQGSELGLSPMVSLFNIYYIEGTPTLAVHIINGLLLKEGSTVFRTIENSVYIDADEKPCLKSKASSTRTTIEFTRTLKDGSILKENASMTWDEVKVAELNTKSNWKKYPKVMLWNRTFTIGAKRIAPDILNGMSETSEIADANNITYDVDENGNII